MDQDLNVRSDTLNLIQMKIGDMLELTDIKDFSEQNYDSSDIKKIKINK